VSVRPRRRAFFELALFLFLMLTPAVRQLFAEKFCGYLGYRNLFLRFRSRDGAHRPMHRGTRYMVSQMCRSPAGPADQPDQRRTFISIAPSQIPNERMANGASTEGELPLRKG
jgi:hypothetical protein